MFGASDRRQQQGVPALDLEGARPGESGECAGASRRGTPGTEHVGGGGGPAGGGVRPVKTLACIVRDAGQVSAAAQLRQDRSGVAGWKSL